MKKSYFIVSMIFSLLVHSCENSFNMIKPVTEEQRQTEMIKSVPPSLNYYYKEKVNQYFYNIE